MEEPMTEKIRKKRLRNLKSELQSVKSEVWGLKSKDTSRFPYRSHKTKKKPKEKTPTQCALDTTIRKQTHITLIRHEPSYKQLEVETKRLYTEITTRNPKRKDT
jgi:hypothetical protein